VTKPKVALIYDTDGWSFHHIAQQIERHLSDVCEFSLFSIHKPDREFLLEADAAICLWYGAVQYLQQGRPEGAFWQQRIVPEHCKIIACVFDEVLRWHEPDIRKILTSVCRTVDMMLLACEGMERRMFPELPLPKRLDLCEDGVDLKMFPFAPHRPEVRDLNRPLLVGWTGNSDPTHFGKIKGLDLIKEACSQVQGVEFVYHDRDKHGLLAHDQMPALYQGIDVYVCMSACEGTPNPILEASATGRAWISTDVGIVSRLYQDSINLFRVAEGTKMRPTIQDAVPPGLIIPREVSILVAALERLRDDRDLVVRMGVSAWDAAQSFWGWHHKTMQYRSALKDVGVLS